MQHGAGSAREFHIVDLPIGLVGLSERSAGCVELAFQCRLEKQTLDPVWIAVEQGVHRSKPANSQKLSLMLRASRC